MSLEIKKRACIFDDLKKYDYLAEESDFIEITEWANKEGWDISFKDKILSLSIGQLDAINYLTNSLKYSIQKL